MRPHHAIFSLMTLLFLLLFCSCAALFLGMFFLESFRLYLMEKIHTTPEVFLYLGGSFAILAIFFFISFSSMQSSRFLCIEAKPYAYSISPLIIKKTLQDLMQKYLDDDQIIIETMFLPSKNLEIIVYLSEKQKNQEKEISLWAEKAFTTSLWENFHFDKKFFLVFYPA